MAEKKSKIKISSAIIVLVIVLFFSIIFGVIQYADSQRFQNLYYQEKSAKETAEAQLQTKTREVESLRTELSSAEQELFQVKAQLSTAREELEQTELLIEEQQEQMEEINREVVRSATHLKRHPI